MNFSLWTEFTGHFQFIRKSVNLFVLIAAVSLVTRARAGTMVGNGGGLNESALVYAHLNYLRFTLICKNDSSCADRNLAARLPKLEKCFLSLPSVVKFSIPKDTPGLSGLPYLLEANSITYNREMLYETAGSSGISFGFAFLTRVLLNHCDGMDFDQSRALVAPIEGYFDHVREQVTVGTSRVALPKSDWIVLRNGFNDILLEAKESLYRISCSGKLDDCTLSDGTDASNYHFESLSLANETLAQDNSTVRFRLEGLAYSNASKLPENFRLEVTANKGEIQSLLWQGRELIKSKIFALAVPPNQRRAADLQVGSMLQIQLKDPTLLDSLEHRWQTGSVENGVRCTLSINSHFNRGLAETVGTVTYTVTENNSNNSVSAAGEVRDEFAVWLTTENKELPYLALDCFRIYLRSKSPPSPLTMAMVTDLLQQPGLFQTPLMNPQASRTAADFAPSFSTASRVKLLQPLTFSAVKNDRGFTLQQPLLQFGDVVKQVDDNIPYCYVSFRDPAYDDKPYELTVPAGLDFSIDYLTGLDSSDRGYDYQLFSIHLKQVGGGAELTLNCTSLKRYFTNFDEVLGHVRSVFNIAF